MTVDFAGMTVDFAGMTVDFAGMTVDFAGMTVVFAGMTAVYVQGHILAVHRGQQGRGPTMKMSCRVPVSAGAVIAVLLLSACGGSGNDSAAAFMERAERDLEALSVKSATASWVAANFITEDTENLSADAQTRVAIALQKYALEARSFDGHSLPPALARKMMLLKLGLTAPPPGDSAEAEELTRLQVGIEADYGRGKYCRQAQAPARGEECLDINAITRIIASSRNPAELLDVWTGWHSVAPPMRNDFTRFVELSNKGARELGFSDVGAMWRSNYDMPPEDFVRELERLWEQVKPLYLSLHTYVRSRLSQQYGAALVPPDGPVPAHLLGNIWAQDWSNVSELVSPPGPRRSYDLAQLLRQKGTDPVAMVHYGENFFSSLGFDKLPETFWTRSLFVKPRDRDVVCHASAWDIDQKDDLRIKMCIEGTADDFETVHHELGHNYYQRAYRNLPFMFRNGAHDGFHEAIGDAVALSISPGYLKQIGLLQDVPGPDGDIGLLLNQALSKVAFLPFGVLIDQWRWKVFSGEITPDNYNAAWWELRTRYQGVSDPRGSAGATLPETNFDPGAKFHVPANVPYTRYFLAAVLQFQFHRELCREAGFTGPLHRCSIYGSRAAGTKLNSMLERGQSQPWQETLAELTGQREMDATAIIDYFAPLKEWLDKQNEGKRSGW
jgi:peptidyl-dipeptidase A